MNCVELKLSLSILTLWRNDRTRKNKFVRFKPLLDDGSFVSLASFDFGLVERCVHATNAIQRHKKRSWYFSAKDVAINYFQFRQWCIVPISAFTFLNKFELYSKYYLTQQVFVIFYTLTCVSAIFSFVVLPSGVAHVSARKGCWDFISVLITSC